MRKSVTPDDIKLMNELYLTLHTYAAVSRKVGFSPTTVKKYIDNEYSFYKQKQKKKSKCEQEIIPPEKLKSMPACREDWQNLLRMTQEEREDCERLREEILL